MKKRFVAAVLLITLLLTNLPVSTSMADSASEEEDPAVIHVLNDLINYIYQCECIYEDLEWAADSFSRYDGERTWENKTFVPPEIVLQPYNETLADNVMQRALDAYVAAGKQYESLSSLTAAAMESPEAFEDQLVYYKNGGLIEAMDLKSSLVFLNKMLESGEVMPWSDLPMDKVVCEQLLRLPHDREEEYQKYVSVLEHVMTDDLAYQKYGQIYPDLFSQLLEIDAKIAAEMYLIVCEPHLTGKYADHAVNPESFRKTYATVSKQNDLKEQEKGDLSRLETLKEKRDDLLVAIGKCGALKDYGK